MTAEFTGSPAPEIQVETHLGTDVVRIEKLNAAAGIFAGLNGTEDVVFTGVLVELAGTVNTSGEPFNAKLIFTVDQWIELQLRGEEAAHAAIALADLIG